MTPRVLTKVAVGMVLFVFVSFAESVAETRADFIQKFYQHMFGRPASESEVIVWKDYLSRHPDMIGAGSMVYWLCDQPESYNQPTTPWSYIWNLYEAVLGRPPSEEDLASWVSNGYIAEVNGVTSLFINTWEFYYRFLLNIRSRNRETASEFVTGLYKHVFGQETPDQEAVAIWTDYLIATADASGVAFWFLNSMEYLGVPRGLEQHIRILFRALLGSEPNEEDLAKWIYYSKKAIRNVHAGFVTSAEFKTRFEAILRQAPSEEIPDPRPRAGIGAILDIGPGVPQEVVALIDEGLTLAENFFEEHLGGGIPEEVRRAIVVKIVATGQGNQELGANGACCTAFDLSPSGAFIIRPFFDVNQGFWGVPAQVYRVVAHEYAHGLQHEIGCVSAYGIPLASWLTEGMAEHFSYAAIMDAGLMTASEIMSYVTSYARGAGALSRPLRDFGGVTFDIWPGHVGYIALDPLVRRMSGGVMSLRALCEEVAHGATMSSAFGTVFGVDLEQFYSEFEVVRQDLLSIR